MSEMLRIERATLQLGERTLLHDFDLTLNVGEWVCISGESGCGKTSLLRAIMGFLPFQVGTVRIQGTELSAQTVEQLRKKVAYVPQELFLPAESVEEMFRIPFGLKANKGKNITSDKRQKLHSLVAHGVRRQCRCRQQRFVRRVKNVWSCRQVSRFHR